MMQNKATFEFVSYRFEPQKKRIFFDYKLSQKGIEPVLFTETIILPKIPNLKNIPTEAVKKALQGAHIALGVSYYKLFCAEKIKLSYILSKEGADFWNVFYKKGLGEFFYKNK